MRTRIFLLLVLAALLGSCSKGFLDTKSRTDLFLASSLNDLVKMLENDILTVTPALPVLSADEYYYRSVGVWQTATPTERNSYLWSKDVFGGEVARQDWNYPYTGIFYANNVLESLASMDSAGTAEGKMIRGWALFIRAFHHYNLVKNFAPIYNKETAASDPGVPIKLHAGVDEIVPRASVQEVYNQVIQDLQTARGLLSTTLPANRNRPSVMAVDALLARIGITMRDYQMAEQYADSCLSKYKTLIDYNTITNTSIPFEQNNLETLFCSTIVQTYAVSRIGSTTNTFMSVDTLLLKQYNTNDWRATYYYGKTGVYTVFKRGYAGVGAAFPFTGLATDEVYLIKAECAARRNAVDVSLQYLNDLLKNRYKTNTYTNLTASSGAEALQLVLTERKKELVWRGLRWDDLARLNKEGANISLTRVLDGQVYTLLPNSPRYVFNIPADEIALSGISQNAR